MEGKHKVSVFFAGKEIPKSPYYVLVESPAGDASKVIATGPGLLPEGVLVGKNTYFDLLTKGDFHSGYFSFYCPVVEVLKF